MAESVEAQSIANNILARVLKIAWWDLKDTYVWEKLKDDRWLQGMLNPIQAGL